ncbi:Cro/Cl family transcriptional regulator [Ralstonia mannitolilytica]|uniref:Cro/Cl family transcriptional regulator n=1 Tax=Ralstonia mannitolilytica TaxID=105219 RepID=UPI000CED8BC8|nr:Cro/Cl family transcriptional regulator [Ralstonia mannitolilytica]
MRVEKYLDEAIARHGVKNDRGLAKLLELVPSAVSHYRTGRRSMDNEVCLRLAQLLDMENPMPIIMAADMDRAERAGQRSLWEVFSPRMAHSGLMAVLVALGLGVTNFVTPSTAKAAPLSHLPTLNTLHYVK